MSLIAKFPKTVVTLFQKLEKAGVRFCLVGGAARDYLIEGNLVCDLDFEYRLDSEKSSFSEILKAHNFTFETLPYGIFRFDFEGYSLEFSMPRIEESLVENNSHHHFMAHFSNQYSYLESFKRRDLTINAIGIELDFSHLAEKIIDPYFGVRDLEDKILKEVSDDFFFDYVRLFRLIRFQLKFGYEISPSILNSINRFDLTQVSYFHLKNELEKSGNVLKFLSKLKLLTQNNTLMARELSELLALDYNQSSMQKIKNIDDLIVALIKMKQVNLAKFFISQFHLKKVNFSSLFLFLENYEFLEKNEGDFLNIEFKKALKYYLEHQKEFEILEIPELYPYNIFNELVIDSQMIQEQPIELRNFYKIDQYLMRFLNNLKK